MKIGLILDGSSSMSADRERTISGVNEYLDGLRAKKDTKKAEVTLVTFSSLEGVTFVHRNVKATKVPALTKKDYRCNGMTPLYDAIGKVIGEVEDDAKDDEKVLIVIQTDGMENDSREFDRAAIGALIKEMESRGNWTFVFLGADLDAWSAQGRMGLGMSYGNTMSYDKAKTGTAMRRLAAQTTAYAASAELSTARFFGDPDAFGASPDRTGTNPAAGADRTEVTSRKLGGEGIPSPGSDGSGGSAVLQGRSARGDQGDAMLKPAEAAQALGVSLSTLQRLRSAGEGPAYAKLGERTVRYAREDVDAWRRQNAGQPDQPGQRSGASGWSDALKKTVG